MDVSVVYLVCGRAYISAGGQAGSTAAGKKQKASSARLLTCP